MSNKIDARDLVLIEELAKKYGMSSVDFGKAVVYQTKKKTQRQFRVSDEEYAIISQRAKAEDMSVMRFCEKACADILCDGDISIDFYGQKSYGKSRMKRIAVDFRNENVEREILELADFLNAEVGTLIRYCALRA